MKTLVSIVSIESQEEFARAELSATRIKALIKAYEKAGIAVEMKVAA